MTPSAQTTLSYRSLSSFFYADVQPTPVSAPQWISYNQTLAAELQLPFVLTPEFALTPTFEQEALAIFAGNFPQQNQPSWMTPFSQAYAGHQFGHFNPALGDGRAIMLTEIPNQTGQLLDVQLKGAGRTPFSRSGDGRSPLGPVLREYLVSETMHAYGVPTTRSLAAVATGDWVYRDTAEPGAILTRVATSHIRVGTFQFAWAHHGKEGVQELADYVIQRHFPHLEHSEQPYLQLLLAVIERQANLISHWMSLGFIHGVMNTDNTSICGETIDYGPCAFMDTYQAMQVYSFIDQRGRYCYQNQPLIGQWNMARLAETLVELIRLPQESDTTLTARIAAVLDSFQPLYQQFWLQKFAQKLGIHHAQASDQFLIEQLLQLFEQHQIDFTLGFRLLAYELTDEPATNTTSAGTARLFQQPDAFLAWKTAWLQRTNSQSKALIEQVNPVLIPRNHLLAQAIQTATKTGDLSLFQELLDCLAKPFAAEYLSHRFAQPPKTTEQIEHTFCGT